MRTSLTASSGAEEHDRIEAILRSVAEELGDLARVGDRLQGPISDALIASGAADRARLKEFQAIDLLVQRLHGLGQFVEALSHLTPAGWVLNCAPAVEKVSLTDLARRLAGKHAAGIVGDEGFEGDLELFV